MPNPQNTGSGDDAAVAEGSIEAELGGLDAEEEEEACLPGIDTSPQWFTSNTRSSTLRNLPPPAGWAWRSSSRWDEEFWEGYATWGWYGSRTPEFKPNIRSLAHDQALLQRPAQCTGDTLF